MKNGFKILCLATGAIFFALLLAEGALRLVAVEPRYGMNWVPHPVLGHTGPRSEILQVGYDEAIYNRTGFRDVPTVEGPPLEPMPRIVVMGDSFTEAWSIYGRHVYTKKLERLLSIKSGLEYEVIAFGASDYGTAQELLAYNEYGRQFNPDIVLLQFFGLNDFLNNSVDFAFKNQGRSDFARPYLLYGDDAQKYPKHHEFDSLGYTYLESAGVTAPLRRFLRLHSRLYGLGEAVLKSREWAKLNLLAPQKCSVELELFLAERPGAWPKAVEITERLILSFKAVVANRVAPEQLPKKYFKGQAPILLGMYIPSALEIKNEVWQNTVVKSLGECFPGKAVDRLAGEKSFLSAFTKAGAPALSLREAFSRAHLRGGELYLPDGHLTYEGHAVAAEALRDFVLTEQKRALGQ